MHKDFAGLKGVWAFGVMDGHGIQGHLISQYVKQQLPLIIGKMMKGMSVDDMKGKGNGKRGNSPNGAFPTNGFLP